MKNAKNTEEEKVEDPGLNKREIIITTDGSSINITKNETAGALELAAILQTILAKLTQQR
jgi:hypothetical protein